MLAQIDELGTDLLVVRAGNDMFGDRATLPVESTAMVRRVGPVNAASAVSTLDTEVRRNELTTTQNGIDVLAAETELLIDTLDGTLAAGVVPRRRIERAAGGRARFGRRRTARDRRASPGVRWCRSPARSSP